MSKQEDFETFKEEVREMPPRMKNTKLANLVAEQEEQYKQV